VTGTQKFGGGGSEKRVGRDKIGTPKKKGLGGEKVGGIVNGRIILSLPESIGGGRLPNVLSCGENFRREKGKNGTG